MIRLSRREFERLARRAYRQLPPDFRERLDNVDITIQEWPGPEAAGLMEDTGGLLGLYTGIPLTQREGGAPELPDRICLYRQPILRSCSTRAQVVEEVRVTLWHEVGHYLGLNEEDLHRLGYG